MSSTRRRRDLTGKVVAITGAARGIGLATASALAGAGMRVAIGDLDGDRAEVKAREIGRGTVAFGLDVADRGSFERFLDETEGRLGPVDVLVNNAGFMRIGSFLDEDETTERGMVEVNVHGVVLGMKLVLPRMLERGRGHIVNIASTGGRVGVAGAVTYCGTKFFVYGASEALRAELYGTGIDISCVMPGHVRTELTSGLHENRYVRVVEPEQVAVTILGALERPRFDVWMPRELGPVTAISGLIPRRAREAMARRAGADKYLFDFDHAARAAYDQRTAARRSSGAL